MISLLHRASLMPPWLRAVLVLVFVAIGSIAHTSAAATSAPGTVVDGTSVPFAGHCIGPGCEQQAHHASECCGTGPCGCVFETPSALSFAEAGHIEHFRFEPRWTRQLRQGIDRPPKQAKVFNLLPPQQDTV